jgi:hypothetical protein
VIREFLKIKSKIIPILLRKAAHPTAGEQTPCHSGKTIIFIQQLYFHEAGWYLERQRAQFLLKNRTQLFEFCM